MTRDFFSNCQFISVYFCLETSFSPELFELCLGPPFLVTLGGSCARLHPDALGHTHTSAREPRLVRGPAAASLRPPGSRSSGPWSTPHGLALQNDQDPENHSGHTECTPLCQTPVLLSTGHRGLELLVRWAASLLAQTEGLLIPEGKEVTFPAFSFLVGRG